MDLSSNSSSATQPSVTEYLYDIYNVLLEISGTLRDVRDVLERERV